MEVRVQARGQQAGRTVVVGGAVGAEAGRVTVWLHWYWSSEQGLPQTEPMAQQAAFPAFEGSVMQLFWEAGVECYSQHFDGR